MRPLITHGCNWPGCKEQVPPNRWGCAHHWHLLPIGIRSRLFGYYRMGQHRSVRGPSPEYLKANHEAQQWAVKTCRLDNAAFAHPPSLAVSSERTDAIKPGREPPCTSADSEKPEPKEPETSTSKEGSAGGDDLWSVWR